MDEDLIADLTTDILQRRDMRSLEGIVESLPDAYDIQDAVVAGLGPMCGRKIAINAPALMDMAGVKAPIVGQIAGQAALNTGVNLSLSEYSELALEPEFAAVIGQDVPAGTLVTRETLPEYIERFSLAFEVLDKRKDRNPMHAPTFVANNVFNAGVVLGHDSLDIAALDDGRYDADFTAVGEVMVSGRATAPQNPIEACLFVVNHFTARAQTVKAGEVILCGAHHPPMVIGAVGRYVFSLSLGEEVSLSISS